MSIRVLRYNQVSNRYSKGSATYDRFAGAFIEAAELRGRVEQQAIFNLVRDLNRSGLWSKMKAVYPFIGGTASSHKWNLIDPQDTDAAFRLTFSGGWTHASTGALPNGTNAYADTFVTPSTHLSQDSTHVSYYSRQDSSNTGVVIGVERQSPPNTRSTFIQPDVSGVTYTNVNGEVLGVVFLQFSDTNGAAYYIANRTASNTQSAYRNATKAVTSTTSNSDGLSTSTINLAALVRANTRQFWSDKECAFATIGDGLTDAEATLLYECVDRYQKFLGRAV